MFRLLLQLIALFLCVDLHAGTIHVRQNSKISSIHTAIEIAQAYDEIIIHEGTYREGNLIIDKPITISGMNHPVIDGENKSEILTIVSDHVNIYGLTLRNTGYSSMNDLAAIKLMTAKHCRIEKNIIENSCYGIYLLNCSLCVVKENNINALEMTEQRSGNGIHAWKSDSFTIINNTITGHRDGIYFEFVSFAGVYDNISKYNLRYGIHFMFSNDDEYIGNTFSHNGSGVAVMFSKNVTIRKNTFENSEGGASYGILLKEINDSRIEENKFIHNTMGLYLEGSNRMLISRNLFQSNGWGCRVQASCYGVTVNQNNFYANSFDIATNGSLSMNNFNGNYWDKYEGYDLNKDFIGDVPYQPVSLYSVIVERMPYALILYRSFIVYLLDRSEKVIPSIATSTLTDHFPLMQAVDL